MTFGHSEDPREDALMEAYRQLGERGKKASAPVATELVECLADVQHVIWAHWMAYLFSVCEKKDYFILKHTVIPEEKVRRWTRQMYAHYSLMPEGEKESERDQAWKVLEALDAAGFDVVKREEKD